MILCSPTVPRYEHPVRSRTRETGNRYSLAVPTIQTGPCDSDMIPRPLQMLICGPLSMSWSAVHTQRPSRYALEDVVRCNPMNAAKHAAPLVAEVGHWLACKFVPSSVQETQA